MLTTRTTIPWFRPAVMAALLPLAAIAVLCAWQSDAALQIGIRAALLLGGVATVLLFDRD